MPTFLNALKRTGKVNQTVMTVLLCVVIVGGIGLTIWGIMQRDKPVEYKDLPVAMKCTKCSHEFSVMRSEAEQAFDYNLRLTIMDCPSCKAPKSSLETYECPKCHTKFILPNVMVTFEGKDPAVEGTKDICPKCSVNVMEVHAK